jgi:hypothetical protein
LSKSGELPCIKVLHTASAQESLDTQFRTVAGLQAVVIIQPNNIIIFPERDFVAFGHSFIHSVLTVCLLPGTVPGPEDLQNKVDKVPALLLSILPFERPMVPSRTAYGVPASWR